MILCYLVESGTTSLSKIVAFPVIVINIKSGKCKTVVAKKRVAPIAQVHFCKVEAILIAFWADSEPRVAGKPLVAAPVL